MDKEINLKKLVKKILALMISAIAMALVNALDIFRIAVVNPVFIIVAIAASFVFALFAIAFKYYYLTKTQKYKYYQLIDFLMMLNIALLFVQIFFAVAFFPATVDKQSMMPTLLDGDKLLVKSIGKPENFDIVILEVDGKINTFALPEEDRFIVKRVIAVPGDTFYFDESGVLFLNNQEINETYLKDEFGGFRIGTDYFKSQTIADLATVKGEFICDSGECAVPDDYYFVLGDNRSNSYDSEELGLFHKSQLVGIVKYRRVGFLDWMAL